MALPLERSSPFASLRLRDYRWYWFSGLGMTGAQNIQRLAMAWLILDLTGSVGQLGLMIFVMGLPMTLTSLWGGVLADRYDRRRILQVSQTFMAANLSLLALLTLTEAVQSWHVYLSSAGLGVMQAITMPARNAIIRGLVPADHMRNAVALNTIQMQSAQVIWPSVGGGLIALVGVWATLAASAACSSLAILFLAFVHLQPYERPQRATSPLRELREGVRYVFVDPRVNALVSMAFCVGCFGLPYMSLAPGFARETLGLNAGQTGLFLMAMGIGSITGSLTMLTVGVRDNLRMYFIGAACMGTSLALLGASPWALLAVLPAGMFGICLAVMIVSGQTLLQTEVPQDLLGRTTSVWSLAGGLGLGASLPIGAVGDMFGLRVALAGAGLLLLTFVLANGLIRTAVLRPRRRPVPASAGRP